jgi:RTX calcium-binding nonapeptide repeat (4 copies)
VGVVLAAAVLAAGPVRAATLQVDVIDAQAGTPANPNPVIADFNYDSGAAVPNPGAPFGTFALTFDRGLRLGASGLQSCTPEQVQADNTMCPLESQVGDGGALMFVPPEFPEDGEDTQRVSLTAYNAPGGNGLELLATTSFPDSRTLVPTSLSGQTLTFQWPASLQLLGPGGADALVNFGLSLGQSQAQGTTDRTLPSWVSAVGCAQQWTFTGVAADPAGSAPASTTIDCFAAPPATLDSPGIATLPKPKTRRPGGRKLTGPCAHAGAGVQCGEGNGRRTSGGGEKVSHKGWPAVTGVLMIADDHGRRMVGGPRNDELLGANGSDHITGGSGKDIIWGDEWPVPRNGTRQHDTMSGGRGNDWIYTSHGTNTINAGPGNDIIYAYYGKGTINCGPGNDLVFTRRLKSNIHFTMRHCERTGKI